MRADPVNLDHLLTKTAHLFQTLYVVRDHFGLKPRREHIATCLNYADLQEMRADFVRALVGTVTGFVYSHAEQRAFLAELSHDRDESAAWYELLRRSREKFRADNLRGQFSELLLFNVLQHFFRAVPVVRKMKITTNPHLERNGADAIHVAAGPDGYRLYIGEAKSYKRAAHSLRAALKEAIKDVVDKHAKHRSELNLYLFEGFVPPELEALIGDYKSGRLPEATVELVCLVTFDAPPPDGNSREELIESAVAHVREEALHAAKGALFASIPPALVPRMNYVLVPMSDLDDLVNVFARELNAGPIR